MNVRSWRGAASMLVYAALAAVVGRQVLAHVGSQVANDPGDPLLTAAILHWNATHLPWTDAWYQLPIFFPTRDTLTFSEHLLGLSVVAAPLQWITGNPLATYNLTLLLTFVLSAAAMYALVWRLTGSAGAAFLAGAAFGFAPYRVSQLPHIQMLAAFYAPLALLGLHAYVETGRRRWLLLYGGAWALQAAANGYMLVFFSVLVGLWVAWFVMAAGKWRALMPIAVTTVVAALPLAPILVRYVRVHDAHGFVRSVDEIRSFSPDILGLFCAPPALTFWGWIRVACRPEGELFPGVAVALLCGAAAVYTVGVRRGTAAPAVPVVRIAIGLLLAVGVIYLAIAASVWWIGPWRLTLGVVRASASSLGKPLVIGVAALCAAALLRPGARAAIRRSSTLAFYLFAGVAMWALSLGPRPRLAEAPVEYDGPFAWLMLLPGGDSLRVPARFWLVATLCFAVVVGLYVAHLLRGRSRRAGLVIVPLLSIAVLADGWTTIPAQAFEAGVPGAPQLAGKAVLELPIEDGVDIAAEYRAMTGGWRSVNGYSGFVPLHYLVLREGVERRADALFDALVARSALAVLVPRQDSDWQRVLRRQPGVRVVAEDAQRTQFLLPLRPPPSRAGAMRLSIQRLSSNCDAGALGYALDGDASTRWVCGPVDVEEQVTADLGSVQSAGAVMHGSVAGLPDYPRRLRIETSLDGQAWVDAWSGDTVGAAFDAAIADPRVLRLWLVFEPRAARYVRVTHPAQDRDYSWSLAELEVWSR